MEHNSLTAQDKHTTLIAGPYIGELGWEIMCWQGYVRRMAKRFKRVIVICRTGHEALYQDFATNFFPYNPQGEETDMWKNRSEPAHIPWQVTKQVVETLCQGESTYVLPGDTYRARWWDSESWNQQQDFVPYYTCFGKRSWQVDVVLHVRHTAKCNTAFRNWPRQHAQQIADYYIKRGLRVACVGLTGSALTVDGAVDLRDQSIQSIIEMMSEAQILVGPQSGPAHLATLCGLPCVCWQTKLEHATRMKTRWNPFNVQVEALPAPTDNYWKDRRMWLPPVMAVTNAADTILTKGKKS